MINLIPSSSLAALAEEGVKGGGREGGQEEEEEMQRIGKGWGTLIPFQNGVQHMKRKERRKDVEHGTVQTVEILFSF